jgi:UDPglucose 6-dehydrogenase
LRQGQALRDNLHPSRIVVGGPTDLAQAFAKLLAEVALDEVPVLLTGRREAEAIKLFSNTYLAMRVAYFNELDSFAATHQLNTRQIIDGVSLDPRIGQHYNNPSFGYGGYCLPKDTKQLLANYAVVPQNLIQAVVQSNSTRHDFVAGEILRRSPKTVGIYLLGMKAGSNSFKDSSVQEVIHRLQAKGVAVLVYEPAIQKASYQGLTVLSDWDAFVQRSDVIVANRITAQLQPVMAKVYTRDIFGGDA